MSFPPVGGSRSPNENASAVGGVGAFNQRRLVLICNVKAYISVQSLISMLSDVVVQPFHTDPPPLSEEKQRKNFSVIVIVVLVLRDPTVITDLPSLIRQINE